MTYQMAIDPGLTGTGYAVFVDGRVHEIGTIYPKGDVVSAKLQRLRNNLVDVFVRLEQTLGNASEVTIEEWQAHYERYKFQSMICCAEARGVIAGVAFSYSNKVRYLSKGNVKKAEADMLAKQLKIEGSEHAKDALHLGFLAGYYGSDRL